MSNDLNKLSSANAEVSNPADSEVPETNGIQESVTSENTEMAGLRQSTCSQWDGRYFWSYQHAPTWKEIFGMIKRKFFGDSF